MHVQMFDVDADADMTWQDMARQGWTQLLETT